MTTTPISSGKASTDQLQGKQGTSSLNANDFINLMVTELKNQDPTQPASNAQLLQQMSEIGQLQTSSSLQTTLTGLSQQNQIGAASSLIGKNVQGLDSNNKPVSGIVTSVQVASGNVSLQLDNGQSLALGSVTSIAQGATSTAGGSSTPVKAA